MRKCYYSGKAVAQGLNPTLSALQVGIQLHGDIVTFSDLLGCIEWPGFSLCSDIPFVLHSALLFFNVVKCIKSEYGRRQLYAGINIFNYIKEKYGQVTLTEERYLERQRTKQAKITKSEDGRRMTAQILKLKVNIRKMESLLVLTFITQLYAPN